ncbi:hypothetical protein L1987_77862 [Smallanthus sonchifolius]|uniref:Uncharacterized protein n=1 Tax=Smallanthus sonchifolius TaxID=185202 RepID=A0ACB8ZB09_9ASTR|nr:hypothetical protein L1987_77862 [Smallanthus sonchifolius]
MGDHKSRSYSYSDGGDMQIERYHGGIGPKRSNFETNPPHNFRSYSVSYGPPSKTNMDLVVAGTGREFDFKKQKSTAKSWSFNDHEFQRKKRVLAIKSTLLKGKLKGLLGRVSGGLKIGTPMLFMDGGKLEWTGNSIRHLLLQVPLKMSRRYDSRTTIFSPEGRLYQVEYAMEAIGNAGSAIGILSKDGVVLVGEKKVTSKLLQTSTSTEKMYKIDDHIACAVAGIMSDANILINTARVQAQRYTFSYQEPMPVEQLVQSLCDTKQGYTQFGGLRPFGVSFLFAGWDKNYRFQLYMSDPSGNYGGWKAAAIGANNQAAQSMLKQDYKDDISREEAVQLALKVLSKTMDSTSLTSDKLELAELFLSSSGKVEYQVCTPDALSKMLVKYGVTQPPADA